jgi:hypothetical protein
MTPDPGPYLSLTTLLSFNTFSSKTIK